ncbi:MAG: hypothetical protein GY821_01690 [Gammaproteobacteria bacterium]|nr:hypothetical protein [Gammaproteobacteria bacterium]
MYAVIIVVVGDLLGIFLDLGFFGAFWIARSYFFSRDPKNFSWDPSTILKFPTIILPKFYRQNAQMGQISAQSAEKSATYPEEMKNRHLNEKSAFLAFFQQIGQMF